MCGLIAYYRTSGPPVEARLIEDMTHAMAHRGPDDYGFCFAGSGKPSFWRNGDPPPPLNEVGVAMGHRRMSIFDLTEAGRQPFISANSRYAMVFNGEIYNYVELRDELTRYGYTFSTDCDTEVFLKAFEKWGTECFPRLNGVWGVVVWDTVSKELVVSRDRLGEKPLLYAQIGGDWVFASEVKALLKHPRITAEPNEQAILRFLANGSSTVGEETFFLGIKSIDPGTFVTFRGGNVSKSKYWNLTSTHHLRGRDEEVLAEELDALITDAVKLRLRGDVRVGAMLSGGLDSTSVISSIAKILSSRLSESRSIGDFLHAFTASYPGRQNDETEKVEELCRLIDIAVHEVFPLEQDLIDERLNEVARALESPFYSPVVIVHDMIMKAIRSTDVQVVLDGFGGDEVFAGFDRCIPLALKDSVNAFRIREAMDNFKAMHDSHSRSYLKEILRLTLREGLFGQKDYSNLLWLHNQGPNKASRLFHNQIRDRDDDWPSNFDDGTMLDRELERALLHTNVPKWARMGDNISMSNSVVCRSPLLDFRIVKFGFGLDNNLKVRKGVTKYILRQAKRDQLPPIILNDTHKVQFTGPAPDWMKGPLKGFLLSLRDGRNSKLSNFVSTNALASIIEGFYNGKGNAHPMWRIVNTEAWLRAFF